VAEDLTTQHSAGTTASATAPAGTRPLVVQRERPSVAYRFRFAIAYLLLAAIAGGAAGGAIVLWDRPEAQPDKWSDWRPTGREAQYASEIADHVSGRYQDAQGQQLVAVLAGPPRVQGEPVTAVAIQADTADPNDLAFESLGKGVMYQLCGGGELCAFRDGQLDAQRLRLLRRQSLELALYSFKYVDDLDSVVTLLPPDPDETTQDPADAATIALFFRKRDFGRELDQPLAQTLRNPTTARVAEMGAQDALLVDRLTRTRLFSYSFTRVQDGTAMMFLTPLSAPAGR
jgi:hypothetical protein